MAGSGVALAGRRDGGARGHPRGLEGGRARPRPASRYPRRGQMSSGPRRDHGIPGEMHVDLEDVRHLTLRYSRAQPEKMNLFVEYVGGRTKVFEVDR
jgi:hypothetical protein